MGLLQFLLMGKPLCRILSLKQQELKTSASAHFSFFHHDAVVPDPGIHKLTVVPQLVLSLSQTAFPVQTYASSSIRHVPPPTSGNPYEMRCYINYQNCNSIALFYWSAHGILFPEKWWFRLTYSFVTQCMCFHLHRLLAAGFVFSQPLGLSWIHPAWISGCIDALGAVQSLI